MELVGRCAATAEERLARCGNTIVKQGEGYVVGVYVVYDIVAYVGGIGHGVVVEKLGNDILGFGQGGERGGKL